MARETKKEEIAEVAYESIKEKGPQDSMELAWDIKSEFDRVSTAEIYQALLSDDRFVSDPEGRWNLSATEEN